MNTFKNAPLGADVDYDSQTVPEERSDNEDGRCPRWKGNTGKLTGLTASLLAIAMTAATIATNPNDKTEISLTEQTLGVSQAAPSEHSVQFVTEMPAYSYGMEEAQVQTVSDGIAEGLEEAYARATSDEQPEASHMELYTFTNAVNSAPFSMVAHIEAAENAEKTAVREAGADGIGKQSYLAESEVREAAEEQELREEKEAHREGATAVKVTASGTEAVNSREEAKAAELERIKAEVRHENTDAAEQEGPVDVSESEVETASGATAPTEEQQVDSQSVVKTPESVPSAAAKQKITVSGPLKDSLDAAAAEKKDQERKAAQREQERIEREEREAEERYQEYLASEQGKRDQLVEAAYSRLGVPYVWGGTDPDYGMDCSGFTQWVYSTLGISTTRTTESQYAAANEIVSVSEALPGDILYTPGHVGLYIGDGAYIHEPQSGDVCRIAYDPEYFSCALRFL